MRALETLHPGNFLLHTAQRWFLALAEVIWKTLASRFVCWFVSVCDCVTAGHVVWDECLRVESRLLCAVTSNCGLACAKLGSFAVFVSYVSMKRSDCRVQKFSLAGSELMDLLKPVVGGNPCKNLAVGAMQGYCKPCHVGSNASPLWSAVLGRNAQ